MYVGKDDKTKIETCDHFSPVRDDVVPLFSKVDVDEHVKMLVPSVRFVWYSYVCSHHRAVTHWVEQWKTIGNGIGTKANDMTETNESRRIEARCTEDGSLLCV